jgi:hypothetical protein
MSQVGRLRVVRLRIYQCLSTVGAVEVPVFNSLRNSCSHVTRSTVVFVRLALKVAMQNDEDFVDVILLYMYTCRINAPRFTVHVLTPEVFDGICYCRSVSLRTSAHGSCNLVRLPSGCNVI